MHVYTERDTVTSAGLWCDDDDDIFLEIQIEASEENNKRIYRNVITNA